LNAGWTWVSINAEAIDMSVNALFTTANKAADDYIKDQNSFSMYYEGFGFYGTLDTVTTETMYKVTLSQGQTITFTGIPVAIPYSKTLVSGWNYLSCPYQLSATLTAGMPQKTWDDGDLVKSQTEFATYYAGFGWYGILEQISPTLGYKLKVTTGATASFNTLRRNLGTSGQEVELLQKRPQWVVEPAKFAESMTLSALVSLSGVHQTAGTLACFVGTEVRGLQATPMTAPFGPYAGTAFFHMTMYSDTNGDKLQFKFHGAGKTTLLHEELVFSANIHKGSIITPLVLTGSDTPARPLFGASL